MYVDRGVTSLFTEECGLTHAQTGIPAGTALRHAQGFTSTLFSVTDEFTAPNDLQKHSTGVPVGRTSVTLVVRWLRRGDAFDVKGFRLQSASGGVSGYRPEAKRREERLKPGRLKITKRAGPTSVRVTVSNLQAGRLYFTVGATKLRGTARVETTLERPAG